MNVYVCQDSEQMHPDAEMGSMLDQQNNVLGHSEGSLVSWVTNVSAMCFMPS